MAKSNTYLSATLRQYLMCNVKYTFLQASLKYIFEAGIQFEATIFYKTVLNDVF